MVDLAPAPSTGPATAPSKPRRRHLTTPYVSVSIVVASLCVSLSPSMSDASENWSVFDLRSIAFALLHTENLRVLPVVAVLILAVGAWAEHVMGWRRVLLAYVGGGLLVSVLGLGIGELERWLLPAVPLNAELYEGAPPVAAVLVVAMAASCFTGALWRRRVRVASVLLAVTVFLYAASASDLYSLVAVPVGIALGMMSGGKKTRLRMQRSSHHETRVLLAAVTAVTAAGPVIATLWGSGAGLLSVYGWLSYDPLLFADGEVCAAGSPAVVCSTADTYTELQSHAGWIAVIPVLVLLLAAWGILRGRRGALSIAIGLNVLVFAGMLHVLAESEPGNFAALASLCGEDTTYVWQALIGLVVATVVPIAVAVTLFDLRRSVSATSTRSARRRFVTTVSVAAVSACGVWLLGNLSIADGLSPRPTTWQLVLDAPLRLLPPTLLPAETVHYVPVEVSSQALWYLIPALFWGACMWATVQLILSKNATVGAADRSRVRAVLKRGSGSLGFMATWPGNSYWFAANTDAGFAYRVHGHIAITLGGAFGVDRHDPDVGRSFVEFCGENGWTPVFYSVDDASAKALEPLGWQRTRVADEAVLRPQTWTPTGKKRQDVRTATNRAQREGVHTQWTTWNTLTLLDRLQLREISEAWVADKTIPEMGFTLGSLDDATDPAVRLMLARDIHDRIIAVTTWIPIFDNTKVIGYALDVMRRRHDAMNGVIEFVIGATVETLRHEGHTVLSLSGSPLASHRDDNSAELPAVDRFLDTLSGLLEPAYGFRSLATFKRKFQPEFTPLWIVYPDAIHLPAIGLALTRCYVPGLTFAGAARLAARTATAKRALPAPAPQSSH